ncbi:CD164 sialomucin-like 2 protein isoform X3 [Rhincodon typus]|uniref:CD164 sialomucin-like 2 protein isoform X3 n=1 Tax=Rhincodon typus TaxID=259920 RepID=UPI00202EC53C|nr:CD164 sialomucin-like 2 protein isoform X3 [Rhincodon typus]
MKWAEIAVRVSLLVLLSGVCEGQTAECTQLETCESCITGDTSLNLTDCVWAQCKSEIFCVEKTSENLTACTIHDEVSMCEVATTAKEALSTAAESDTTTEIPTTTPVYSPSSFDPASFIGGIVLVLGAEAAFFFAVKFFKARDGTYQTLSLGLI